MRAFSVRSQTTICQQQTCEITPDAHSCSLSNAHAHAHHVLSESTTSQQSTMSTTGHDNPTHTHCRIGGGYMSVLLREHNRAVIAFSAHAIVLFCIEYTLAIMSIKNAIPNDLETIVTHATFTISPQFVCMQLGGFLANASGRHWLDLVTHTLCAL